MEGELDAKIKTGEASVDVDKQISERQKREEEEEKKRIARKVENLKNKQQAEQDVLNAEESKLHQEAAIAGKSDAEIHKIHEVYQAKRLASIANFKQELHRIDSNADAEEEKRTLKVYADELANLLNANKQEEALDVARAKAKGASEGEINDIQLNAQGKRIADMQAHLAQIQDIDELAAEQLRKQIANEQYNLQLMLLGDEAKYNAELTSVMSN